MELASAGTEQLRKMHPLVDDTTICRHCQETVSDSYCGKCGTPVTLKRVDAHYIVHEIQHILHFEKGILYTIRALLTQPGKNIRSFISDDRSRLVKPVIFIIITSLIYTIVAHYFHTENHYMSADAPAQPAVSGIMNWIQGHYGYANILMGACIAVWLKLFFRKSDYNFFEVLIMLCFVMGTSMLLLAVFAVAEGLTGSNLTKVSGPLMFVYSAWAIGQFFNGRKLGSYLLSLAAYLLGCLSFMIIAVLIGVAIALAHKV
ncbi:DUF3667 domain-containing protein [Chitinophaga agri]|nr:DUF3667 domain-containing protein [Chitinophaga agri]